MTDLMENSLAKKLYTSREYFIKYSAGRAIACFPHYAGSTYAKVGGESVCNTKSQAQAFLRKKAQQHAAELMKADEWEINAMPAMYWIELDIADGDMVPFPSEEAFDAAQEWYNATTKKKMITYCQHRNVRLDDPTDETALLNCWADLAMATYAWQQVDPKMVPVVGLIAREVANQ